jgi:hypothetical protein
MSSSSSSSSSTTRRNTNSSSARAVVAPTPFCKVCRDAGRPESEYTSHFVKDQPGPNGKVVCPMLLNQACRICEKTGHTSSYCPQYRPRREEREREPRREERYIEREREPRREERRDISFNRLRDDTERLDRETRDRDDSYHREQDRRSKPWLQAALKPASSNDYRVEQPHHERRATRNAPYAHPHGPRVRLNLETSALCASKHAPAVVAATSDSDVIIDVRKVELNHAANWGDEDAAVPFVCDPEQITREFFEETLKANLTTSEEHEFIEQCDDQSKMPFACGE